MARQLVRYEYKVEFETEEGLVNSIKEQLDQIVADVVKGVTPADPYEGTLTPKTSGN